MVQWQRVRVRGREWGLALKEPVTRWQAQEKWMVRRGVRVGVGEDMVEVRWEGPVGGTSWFTVFLFFFVYEK